MSTNKSLFMFRKKKKWIFTSNIKNLWSNEHIPTHIYLLTVNMNILCKKLWIKKYLWNDEKFLSEADYTLDESFWNNDDSPAGNEQFSINFSLLFIFHKLKFPWKLKRKYFSSLILLNRRRRTRSLSTSKNDIVIRWSWKTFKGISTKSGAC